MLHLILLYRVFVLDAIYFLMRVNNVEFVISFLIVHRFTYVAKLDSTLRIVVRKFEILIYNRVDETAIFSITKFIKLSFLVDHRIIWRWNRRIPYSRGVLQFVR